uniref:F-box protein At5g07610-like n=1 Tax=Erigeron canadensis TaxID=72917 RepID=UPI001CB89D3E|nr:F-box protein At5g07610-like [Erigeron canadensis]
MDNRISSNKRVMTDDDRNNNRSSSVHQVVFNDDLLIEILLRLPVISLLFFKSVSKRWLSLITSPAFQMSIPHVASFTRKKNITIHMKLNNIHFWVFWTNPPDRFYVYNPSINMFKMLPQVDGVELDKHSDRMRLAFDPIKSPHYKVPRARVIAPGGIQRGHSIQTWIYSSEAELFESRGCLLLACASNRHPERLNIYEMRRGYSWSVRHTIKYNKAGIASFFEAPKMFVTAFRFKVLFIVLGEREEESFVVLDLYEKVVKYNILSNTLQELCDINLNLTNFGTFPFITSFAGV